LNNLGSSFLLFLTHPLILLGIGYCLFVPTQFFALDRIFLLFWITIILLLSCHYFSEKSIQSSRSFFRRIGDRARTIVTNCCTPPANLLDFLSTLLLPFPVAVNEFCSSVHLVMSSFQLVKCLFLQVPPLHWPIAHPLVLTSLNVPERVCRCGPTFPALGCQGGCFFRCGRPKPL